MKTQNFNENGSITIVGLGLCSIALVLAMGLIRLGGVVSVKGKAQNAADAASLSAAYEIAHFSISKACSSARIAAQKNGAVLESCKYTNNDVEVVVSIDHDGETVKAKARADIK